MRALLLVYTIKRRGFINHNIFFYVKTPFIKKYFENQLIKKGKNDKLQIETKIKNKEKVSITTHSLGNCLYFHTH